MPLFLAAFVGGLISVASSLVGRVLVALLVGYVTYTGLDTALLFFKTQFLSGANALPAGATGVLGLLKVGTCVNIVFSSVMARLVLNGVTSGRLTKMVFKGPAS